MTNIANAVKKAFAAKKACAAENRHTSLHGLEQGSQSGHAEFRKGKATALLNKIHRFVLEHKRVR